jgi:hypothetical protein
VIVHGLDISQIQVAKKLFEEGKIDAIEGNKPVTSKLEYLQGYSQGCQIVQARLKCELAFLKAEASKLEALIKEPF